MRSRRWILVAAVTAALLVGATGCGGDDEETGATTAPAATATTEGGVDGAAVFASAGCGTCHTLAAAGTTGTTGPNLDDLQPDEETVVNQVTNGGGGMPAFGDRLSEEEIDAVAAYVAESAGT